MSGNNNIELRSEEVQEVMNRIPPAIQRWGITTLALIVGVLLAIANFVEIPVTQECEFVIYTKAREDKLVVSMIIPESAIQSVISNDSTKVILHSNLFPSNFRNGIAVVIYQEDILSRPDNRFEVPVHLPAEAESLFLNTRMSISGTANIIASYKTLLECFRLTID